MCPEEVGRRMFHRQVAALDIIAAAADMEWEQDADLRAFWAAEAQFVAALLTLQGT